MKYAIREKKFSFESDLIVNRLRRNRTLTTTCNQLIVVGS